eukprot:2363316-Pleurochrysis_carterae.AAC.1
MYGFEARVVINQHQQRAVVCGSLDALASVQAGQPWKCPWESELGASAVMEGRTRRRLAPACRRYVVHTRGCAVWRHDANVVLGLRRMYCLTP